jgi:hypothetical protein
MPLTKNLIAPRKKIIVFRGKPDKDHANLFDLLHAIKKNLKSDTFSVEKPL